MDAAKVLIKHLKFESLCKYVEVVMIVLTQQVFVCHPKFDKTPKFESLCTCVNDTIYNRLCVTVSHHYNECLQTLCQELNLEWFLKVTRNSKFVVMN